MAQGNKTEGQQDPNGQQGGSTPPPPSEPKVSKIKFVGFSGTVRRITAEDFKQYDIDMEDQEWSPENDHTVDVSGWPEKAVALVLRDREFRAV